MNAKKLNMTEEELQQYCDSLTPQELKKFQLDSKKADIAAAKKIKHIFEINIIFCLATLANMLHHKEMLLAILSGCVLIVSILYAIGYKKRIQQDKQMYRMLEIWFNENL